MQLASGCRVRDDSDGWEPWPLAALERFEAEAKGTPWIGFMLAFYTGQRQADVLAMPWSKIDNDVIEIRQEKTGRHVWVPLHPRLKAALEAIKVEQKARMAERAARGLPAVSGLTIVQREDGRRYTKNGFGSIWQREQARVGIKLPFHGLRKSAVIALLEAGCTTDEVKSITGHSTDEMVTHYGKKVNQRKLAKAAIDKLVGAGNGNKK